MSLCSDIHARHKAFHAAIARRAAELAPKIAPTTKIIPNSPYGIPKIAPPAARPIREEHHWHKMWFYNLVTDLPKMEGPKASVRDVQIAVCREFDVLFSDMIGHVRTAKLALPRQIAFFISKKITGRSLPELGRRFGGRDHTTVLHSVRKIERLIASDEAFKSRVLAIVVSLGGNPNDCEASHSHGAQEDSAAVGASESRASTLVDFAGAEPINSAPRVGGSSERYHEQAVA